MLACCFALGGCSGAETSIEAPIGVEQALVVEAPAVDAAVEPSEPPAPAPASSPSEVQAELEAELPARVGMRARLEAERLAFEAAYPLHGVAFHFLARVHARPTYDSPAVGYLRRGSRFRATERVPGVGCAKGWHEVPGGGFVCRGDGYKVGRAPQTFEPAPTPPSLEDALPYVYAYTPRASLAQFWRVPTIAEEEAVGGVLRARGVAREERAVAEASAIEAPPPPGQSSGPEAADPVDDAEEAAQASADGKPAGALVSAAPAVDPLALPDFVRIGMRRGFYVSLDGSERDAGRTFSRTVRGAYVRADGLLPNEPPTHRGVVLGGAYRLPLAFVYRDGVQRLAREPQSGQLRPSGSFARHTPLVLADTLERSGARYFASTSGDIVRDTGVRVARQIARPAGVGPGDRFIHVDLAEQILVAYDGDRPVFVTTVSTGRPGHETPKGLFRVESKHVSTTMDDLRDDQKPYSIEDVPWTMYFTGNYAIHGAFWHDHFGRVRSHGCVNLAPADARWLFQWTDPILPASWHGVFARPGSPGTYVFVN